MQVPSSRTFPVVVVALAVLAPALRHTLREVRQRPDPAVPELLQLQACAELARGVGPEPVGGRGEHRRERAFPEDAPTSHKGLASTL